MVWNNNMNKNEEYNNKPRESYKINLLTKGIKINYE
jgi:hypothetical protein